MHICSKSMERTFTIDGIFPAKLNAAWKERKFHALKTLFNRCFILPMWYFLGLLPIKKFFLEKLSYIWKEELDINLSAVKLSPLSAIDSHLSKEVKNVTVRIFLKDILQNRSGILCCLYFFPLISFDVENLIIYLILWINFYQVFKPSSGDAFPWLVETIAIDLAACHLGFWRTCYDV